MKRKIRYGRLCNVSPDVAAAIFIVVLIIAFPWFLSFILRYGEWVFRICGN